MVKSVTLLLVALCVSKVSLAQMTSKQALTSRVRFVTFEEGKKTYALTEVQQMLREQLSLKPTDSFVQLRTTTDQRGGVHERYTQYYQGIPVEGGLYLVHARQGRITSIHGDYEPIGKLDIAPSVSEAQALEHALQAAVDTRRFGEQQLPSSAPAEALAKGTLVVASRLTPSLTVTVPTLAWKFDVNDAQSGSHALVYVDAHAGQVLGSVGQTADANSHFSLIKPLALPASIPGTASTYYHGNRAMTVDVAPGGGGYILRELNASGNWHIRTIGYSTNTSSPNYNHVIPATTTLCCNAYFYDYFNTSTNWPLYTQSITTEKAATDVHWGTQIADEFFLTHFQRQGYNNDNDSPIQNVFNRYAPGLAQWRAPSQTPIGTYSAEIWYGSDGNGANGVGPMSSIDVIAHEYGHGIYWSTMNMLTNSGEPGAIHEGLSDIWGACLPGYIGEEDVMWKYGLRTYPAFARPAEDPLSNQYPDQYNGQYFTGYDIHKDATVLSHWFYVLSQGGHRINDSGHASDVVGMGWSDAAAIVYHMETNFLTPNDDFAATRMASLQAASDMFGPGSDIGNEVNQAWLAVNIGDGTNPGIRLASASPPAPQALYPNPATYSATLDLLATPVQPVRASIYNAQGHEVKTIVLDKATNEVDMRDLLPGLYYLRYGQNGQAQSRKFRVER